MLMTVLVRSEVTMLMTELLRPEVTMSPIVPVYEDTRAALQGRARRRCNGTRWCPQSPGGVVTLCGRSLCGTLLLGLKQLPWRAKDTGRGASGPAASPRLRLARSFATPCNCERHHRRLYSQHQAWWCIYG